MTPIWKKAEDAAVQARLLFEAAQYDGACSRAYYAMFNAARALLSLKGFDSSAARTHKTVLRLFSLEFVQKGTFDDEHGRALRRANESRNLADYADEVLSRARAEAVMTAMEKFMAAAGRIIRAADEESGR